MIVLNDVIEDGEEVNTASNTLLVPKGRRRKRVAETPLVKPAQSKVSPADLRIRDGYSGTQTEREQIADALAAIAAVPINYQRVAQAVRAYFGTDKDGTGAGLFSSWVKNSRPNASDPYDVGVDAKNHEDVWCDVGPEPEATPLSLL